MCQETSISINSRWASYVERFKAKCYHLQWWHYFDNDLLNLIMTYLTGRNEFPSCKFQVILIWERLVLIWGLGRLAEVCAVLCLRAGQRLLNLLCIAFVPQSCTAFVNFKCMYFLYRRFSQVLLYLCVCCIGWWAQETHSCRWGGLVAPVSSMLVTLFSLLLSQTSQA